MTKLLKTFQCTTSSTTHITLYLWSKLNHTLHNQAICNHKQSIIQTVRTCSKQKYVHILAYSKYFLLLSL